VALQAYQAQIQAVAALHGQVGSLVVQLREAHADADGASALLQQERKEASSRAVALKSQLVEVKGALAELSGDHEVLRQAHAALVAKDLLATGLLRDRWERMGRKERSVPAHL
jgi:predicted  nucleic acid-binding Zn-ribbon protein